MHMFAGSFPPKTPTCARILENNCSCTSLTPSPLNSPGVCVISSQGVGNSYFGPSSPDAKPFATYISKCKTPAASASKAACLAA